MPVHHQIPDNGPWMARMKPPPVSTAAATFSHDCERSRVAQTGPGASRTSAG
ncbi:hypothetical protein ACFFX0_32955 [Citricoccus parietis]|uniref:Uncharacterized protein n=1 Tax=Citricoccus parietis TaxID=592307 RepID=A0ABV5G9T6_9MICC